MIMLSDTLKYSVLAVMLLAILLAYCKRRNATSADGQSLAWTQVPLIAFLTVSIGPSAIATLIYLGYKLGLLQPGPSGYQFSIFVYAMPLEFAVMNWGFVALYLVGRLLPNFGSPRSAMWLSVIAMSFFNVPLFFLAPEMVSAVFDAGQGIGVVQAMLSMPVWFGPYPKFLDPESAIGLLILAPLAPIPFSGLVGWIGGHFLGGATSSPKGKAARS